MADFPVSRTFGVASLVQMIKNMPRDEKTGEPRFAMLLGAGASKSSGIPTAETLTAGWKQDVFLDLMDEERMTPSLRGLYAEWASGKPVQRKGDLHALPTFAEWKEGVATVERNMSEYAREPPPNPVRPAGRLRVTLGGRARC